MQETGNSQIIKRPRITLRISRNSLSFAVVDTTIEEQVIFEPYTSKSGISMAANLRDAFKTSDLLARDYQRAQVLLDTPVLMIPVEEFDEQAKEALYHHSFPGKENDLVLQSILPDLNAVAVFSINKDLKLVIEDHFADVRFVPVMQPVWSYMHQRSFTGIHRKLYGYFHDDQLDIFSFDKNRFKFCNSFEVSHGHDAVYFLLYVWKQMNFDAEKDELYLSGNILEKDWMTETLKRYVQKAFVISASAEFNRAPITQIKGLPLDLITLFIKGR
ncbi:MAG: DUF3822 family protein [Prevotella sp.]|jgi:hypothetical protein|nr:DUF3822 family protein [Prevotella sp.]MCI1281291.1 DUF3822 family protein [Prevotella sp.]